MASKNSGYNTEGMSDYEETINWEDVGRVIGKGTYDVVVEEATYKPTRENKHMVAVTLKIVSVHDASQSNEIDRVLFENFVFTAKAGFRVKEFMMAAGLEMPPTVSKAILEEWAASIIGIHVTVKVDHREYEGQMRAAVKNFVPYEAGEGNEEEEEEGEEEEDAVEEEEAPPPKKTLREAIAASKQAPPAAKKAKR